MQDTLLSLQHISKNFGEGDVLRDISLDVARGEFVTLLGASGCGKTTTLRIISGLETPDEGTVLLDGRDVTALPPERRPVNTVFQSYALFPHMNVEKNVAYGLRVRRMDKASIEKRVREMLELVQMADFAKRMPSQLSGGQRQRIAIARALAPEPELLLLDEPLGALDLQLRRQMQLELKRLQKKLGITFVYITHDQEEAINMSDRIAVMRGGRFEQLGTPEEIYDEPKTHYVAQFIGRSTILSGRVEAVGKDTAVIRGACGSFTADASRALMTAPMAAFGVLLVALPLIYVLCTSLVTGGKFQFGMPLTLANYKALLREDYLKVFANSLQLAFFTTVISLLVGYPFGYCMARAPRKWKALLMMLVIIPFWTSALVRIYGWKILLQANGPVNGVLRSLGLIQKNIKFLGSYGSVLLAMVYCLISFMILPCHNAVDKMDFTLVEASRDLGASPVRAFLTVTLPLTMPGILAGCVLVFVPSVGLFYLSDIMGGGLVLVGNLIRDQLLKVRDWNVGSAMSMVLIALSAGIYLLYRKVGGDDLGVM